MEINVPTSWNDITVSKYQALSQINREDYKDDLSYIISVIQVVCSIDKATDLPIKAIQDIAPHIEFLQKEPSKERYENVNINGINYSWISSFNSITVGEAVSLEIPIDLEELTIVGAYDVILAVMLREDGKEFNAKEFNKNRELFSQLPITEVIGMLLFF